MSEVVVLRGAELREILQVVIEKKVPAIMSYLFKGKWHVAKVLLTDVGGDRLYVWVSPRKKPHPISIQVAQSVGISSKHRYSKFIFETKVVAFEPSPDGMSGGTMVLAIPERVEVVQRRSYFRVSVPSELQVSVLLWHRGYANGSGQVPPKHCWKGNLIDISAGGAQVVLDAAQRPDFRKGQFIGLRFTPVPDEVPLVLNAQIRNILPTADEENICLGLQMVGLEVSSEGRRVLRRLCNVVERYYQMNRPGIKQQDFQTTGL